MQQRPLGRSGIEASVVGFGAWAIGGWLWGGTDRKAAVDGIRAALEEGITLIDTAPVYGFGLSEELVAEAIEGRRDDVVLATKCGLIWDREEGEFHFASEGKRVFRCLSPASIRAEVEASLKRLKTDRLDLLQTHWQDPTTPIAETMEALVRLKEEGKIRAIGASNATVEQLRAYEAIGPVDSDQERYSMLDRKMEAEQLPYCAEIPVAFLPYSPLANGLLTGKVGPDRTFPAGDLRHGNPRFSTENRARVTAMLEEMKPVADAHDLTFAQLVTAWTAAQPGVTHVLVGARDPAQARENAAAGRARLTGEELAKLTAIIERRAPEIT